MVEIIDVEYRVNGWWWGSDPDAGSDRIGVDSVELDWTGLDLDGVD